MAIQSQPSRIPQPFAGSGTKNVIPATNSTPSASQAASWASGFPPECSQPISAGGCPVPRNDVNGALNWLSQGFAYGQDGGVWSWSALADYDVQRMVRGSNGKLYWSVAQSGPGTGAGSKNPTTDNGTYWQLMPMNDANVVHIAGNEDITGVKTFSASKVIIKNTDANQGSAPLSANIFYDLLCYDASNKRVAGFKVADRTDGSYDVRIYITERGDPDNLTVPATIGVGYDSSGNIYAFSPSTSTSRSSGTDIVTRDWIPQDTRIVHTTGGEVINGNKWFTGDIIRRNTNVTMGSTPTSNQSWYIVFRGTNENSFTQIGTNLLTDDTVRTTFRVHQNDTNGSSFDLHQEITSAGVKSFFPSSSGVTLGANSSANRWGQIYSSSATISTSDERVKRQIAPVPDDVLDAWGDINWVQFKMADSLEEKGESARLHNGMVAQQIDAVFRLHNLDASKYGLFCYDEWEKEDPSCDENGQKVASGHEAGNLYSLRYEEALCMEAAYQRRRADRAEARLAALEERLAAIEDKLNAQP